MSKILKVVGASWLQTKISSYVLGILGILAILALFAGQMERSKEDGNYAATVFYSEKTGYHIEYWGQSNDLANIPQGVARAYCRKDIDTKGWSTLEIETDGTYHDEVQAYAAGIVEGALTWHLIHTHLENTIRAKCDNTPLEKQCNKLRDALTRSLEIWKNYASELADVDPYWHHVSLHYTQIHGILTGWKHGIERSNEEYESDISDLLWLNSMAEIVELQHKLNISLEDEMLESIPDVSSALLRIVHGTDAGETPKLFVAQNAAGRYSSMTRILKRYKLNYHQTSKKGSELVPGTSVDFSSYPGSITSQDEFYVVKGNNHRMAVTGTALRNYNSKLWQAVNITEQVPAGPRITAANHLATNVSSWGHVLARNNAGTASKQWLIVDFNKFDKLGEHPMVPETPVRSEVITEIINNVKHTVYRSNNSHAKGLVELVEQVPGLTHSRDISDAFLAQGYWATYGLPFFKQVAEKTHTDEMETLHGEIFSEVESPRAIIFKEGHENATTAENVIKLMRQNNLTAIYRSKNNSNDIDVNIFEESGYSSVMGIRGDIVDHHKKPYGVIDTKVVCATWNQTAIEFIAVAGPPYTEVVNETDIRINKGNLAPYYIKEFDHQPNIDSIEIKDLVKHLREEDIQRTLEELNKNTVPPFDWSESDFVNDTHRGLPDKWQFVPFKPHWIW